MPEPKKIVKCIMAGGGSAIFLTKDKEYVVVEDDGGDMIQIIDDSNKPGVYFKIRFTEVSYEDPNGDN